MSDKPEAGALVHNTRVAFGVENAKFSFAPDKHDLVAQPAQVNEQALKRRWIRAASFVLLAL